MSAEIRCLVCNWRSRIAGVPAYEEYAGHWCVTDDDLTVNDDEWQAFLARNAHPSTSGGDAA